MTAGIATETEAKIPQATPARQPATRAAPRNAQTMQTRKYIVNY